jgi:hypothetical protein
MLLVAAGVSYTQSLATAQDSYNRPETVKPAIVDPTRIEGHGKCIDCHKLEVKAWLASKHATRAFDLLRTAPTSRKYAENLGIRRVDIARKSLCVNCHATPIVDPAGRRSVLSGVSCEACHNASGGEDGWLNRHAVYGSRGTRRQQESDSHYQDRAAACETAGQFRSENLYQLVKRCFACHVVSDESLVEADHDHGDGFEVVSKMLGEVRHNFFLDQTANAEVATLWTDTLRHAVGRTAVGRKRVAFIVGQLVDLETSLRSLATASEENDFTDLMIDRIDEALALLAEDLLEEVEDTELPEIEQAVAAAEPVFERLDDDGFAAEDKRVYLEAASQVGRAAEAFAARDGSKLEEIDDLDLLPEGPFEGVYQP